MEHKIVVAGRKNIKLTYAIDPTIEVIADEEMLRIVIRNLVNNAIKFTNSGGEIFIKAYKKGIRAEVLVQDNGIGIPMEKQGDIFTLKARSTFGTNSEKGIGLGLRMCKEFIDYQHGDIWFESIAGQGTGFYISLPIARL